MATQPTIPEIAIFLAEQLAGQLSSWERPVVTDYELSVLLCTAYAREGEAIEPGLHEAVVDNLRGFHLISPDKDFKPGTVFNLFGRTRASALEIACAVDPFACATHLSAMEFHGITDRFSKILYLTTPPGKEWKALAQDKMARDLGGHIDAHRAARLPRLRFMPFERIDGMRTELMRRSSRGAFKAIKSPAVRVAMVGRTFLDMLREPDHCGGMQHVVDVYREYAPRNLPLIVQEIESHGKAIEKVRAGYLLQEVCKLSHPLIDGWKSAAQRGGSRMLDPQGEYAAFYSDAWKLSINVPSLVLEGFDNEEGDA